MSQCTGLTLRGTRCKKMCMPESGFCSFHKVTSPKRSPKKKTPSPKRSPKRSPVQTHLTPSQSAAARTLGVSEIIFLTLLNIPPASIKNACATNRQFNQVCQDPVFQKIYIKKYPMNLSNNLARSSGSCLPLTK